MDIIYKNGKPLCINNQIILRLKPAYVNQDVVNNPEKVVGTVQEFIDPGLVFFLKESGYFDERISQMPIEKVFKKLTPQVTHSISRSGNEVPMPSFWCVFLVHWNPNLEMSFLEAIDNFKIFRDYIEYVEPNYVGALDATANDPLYVDGRQAALFPNFLQNGLAQGGDINVEPAWDYSVGSLNVKVGVYDTGIDWYHEDLNFLPAGGNTKFSDSRVKGGWDWIRNEHPSKQWRSDDASSHHGTKMAGIIGAIRNNEKGIAGVAGGDKIKNIEGVQLFSMKICDLHGDCPENYFADALVEGATNSPTFGYGLHICNVSLSWYNYSRLITDAVTFAFENKVFVAAAAGNDNNKDVVQYPADLDDCVVLKVGGNGLGIDISYNTTIGGNMDVMASEADGITWSTSELKSYETSGGTSASTAIASGVAALLLSYKPSLEPEDIEMLMQKNCKDIDSSRVLQNTNPDPIYACKPGWDLSSGWGIIDAGNTLRNIEQGVFDVNHLTTCFDKNDVKARYNTSVYIDHEIGVIKQGWYKAMLSEIHKEVIIAPPNNGIVLDVWGRNANSDIINARNLYLRNYPGVEVLSFDQKKAKIRGYVYFLYEDEFGTPVSHYIPDKRLTGCMDISVYVQLRGGVTSTENVSDSKKASFSITPNPSFDGNFYITFNEVDLNQNYKVEIFNLDAKLVHFESFKGSNAKTLQLNMATMPKGVYYCRVSDGISIETQKIIIQ